MDLQGQMSEYGKLKNNLEANKNIKRDNFKRLIEIKGEIELI